MSLRVIKIVEGTSADGPGLRTSIYLAGCRHACPGCHNPSSWDFEAGEDWSVERLMSVIRYNRFPVTLSGGDPLYQAEQLIELAQQIQAYFAEHPEQNPCKQALWLYTGFCYEEVKDREPYKTLLQYVDVMVDGPFLLRQKPAGAALRFRGSLNQRFIVPATGEELHF